MAKHYIKKLKTRAAAIAASTHGRARVFKGKTKYDRKKKVNPE